MNIYSSNRILDNSYYSNTPSIKNSFEKNTTNYYPLNSNLKKYSYPNSITNFNLNNPNDNLMQNTNLNSNLHINNLNPYKTINIIKNNYNNSEPNLNSDSRYNNIKETSKNLQSRLDKLINHSKEKSLENERNKTYRNQYYNRPLSTQRANSMNMSDGFNNIFPNNDSVISGYKHLNKTIYNEYSSFSKNNNIKNNIPINNFSLSRNIERRNFNSLQKSSNTKIDMIYDSKINYFNDIYSQDKKNSSISQIK